MILHVIKLKLLSKHDVKSIEFRSTRYEAAKSDQRGALLYSPLETPLLCARGKPQGKFFNINTETLIVQNLTW